METNPGNCKLQMGQTLGLTAIIQETCERNEIKPPFRTLKLHAAKLQ